MRGVYATLALALVSSIHAAPLQKRIQQVIADSLTQWEQACINAGGGIRCNPLKVSAFSTLLIAPGPCEQQNAADQMIDLARELNNDAEMIRLAQIFRQQPRNSPTSESVLYCQQAPRNQELAGLFNCQFQGVNDNVFTGGIPLGQPGTVPFGLSSLSPPGSCPANPQGKVPDGVQLVTLVSSPGTPSPAGSNRGNPPPAQPPAAEAPATTAAAPPAVTPSNQNPPPAAGSGLQFTNAQDAQSQNVQFASLQEGGPCTPGQVACIDGSFAQCPFGTFVLTPCTGGTQCLALPLVNSPGTSIACTTLDDAARRFDGAGVSGGFDGRQ